MATAPSLNSEPVRFCLEAVKGPHAGQKFEFDKVSVTIGRGPENDVVLSSDPRVSRQHVEIKQSLGQFYVVNLSQKNFVLVDGQNVDSDKIASKSKIQIGETELKLTVLGTTNLLEPLSADPVPASSQTPRAGTVVPMRPSMPSPPRAPGAPPAHAPSGGPPAGAFVPPPQPPPSWGPPPGATASRPRPVPAASDGAKKLRNYLIIGAALAGLFFMFGRNNSRPVAMKPFRTAEEIDLSRQEAENDIKAFRERRDKMQATIYQKAYENFLRGYRDYRQGQYSRAREAFQVVLNLDPGNELAHRYYNLAKIRFDETVKFHLLQGRRYLERQNFRMCRSNFQTVMAMLGNDPSNPDYQEARLKHDRCTAAIQGRF